MTGPSSATFQWVLAAWWKPTFPDTWTMATQDDVCHAKIGVCNTDDARIQQEYKSAITFKAWDEAARRYDGKLTGCRKWGAVHPIGQQHPDVIQGG